MRLPEQLVRLGHLVGTEVDNVRAPGRAKLESAYVIRPQSSDLILEVWRDLVAERADRPPIVSCHDQSVSVKIAFSTLACPAWSLRQVVEAAREYGYDGVELRLVDGELIDARMSRAQCDRVRETFAAGEVPIVGVDTSINVAADEPAKAVGQLKAFVELACEWQSPIVRVFGGEGDAAHARHVLGEAATVAETLGVTLALETHDHFSSSARVAEVLDGLPPAVAALWDIAHPYRIGESCQAVLAALHGRIAHVHVKDARPDGVPTLLGEGDVPVKSCVEALLKTGYLGWLSVEWEKRWHPELAEPEVALPQFATILRSWKLD